MKILFFAQTPPPHHGQSFMARMTLRALENDRERFEVYHINARFSEEIAGIGAFHWSKPLRLLKYCAETLRLWMQRRPKVLYYIPAPGLRIALYRDWCILGLLRLFYPKLIFHWQAAGLEEWLQQHANAVERFITSLTHGRADLSIVLGAFFKKDAAYLRPKKVVVVPNAAPDPCPDFERVLLPKRRTRLSAIAESLKQSASHPPVRFGVLFLSTCMREKGLFDCVEAVAKANQALRSRQSRVEISLVVAGSFYRPEEQEQFERRIAEADFQSQVFGQSLAAYKGFVSGDTKRQLFEEADCFCFPSFYPMEAFPVSLVEAMAYGLPIVATRWRALPELLPDGYEGLVDINAPEQISRCLLAFLDHYPGAVLREHFEKRYAEEHFASQIREAIWAGLNDAA